jgi:sugar phosphate isomerase/epimerase
MASLSTVAAFGFDDFDPPRTLSLYRQLGCTGCQFYRNQANPPTVDDAIAITQDAGVPIDSIHGVFGPGYDPASPQEQVRLDAIETYRREGELAAALGGPAVVVHPSPISPDDLPITPAQRDRRLGPLRKSIEDLAEVGARLGVVYLWENIPNNYFVGNDPLQLADLLRQVDNPHARMCFDTGHALMTGTVADRLAGCADVVGYMHVHDNNGREDSHLMPGEGAIDWPALGRVLRSGQLNVPAMLEVFYLEDRLRQLVAGDLRDKLARWLAVQGR